MSALIPTSEEWRVMPLSARRTTMSRMKQICKAAAEQGGAVTCALKETHAGRVHAREVVIPQGTIAVGKIHKQEQINFLMQGELLIVTENTVTHITAPATIVSSENTHKIAYALEDAIWVEVFASDEDDTERRTAEVVTDTYTRNALEGVCHSSQ